ncbi:PRC-barrel domain-containing protein [Methanosarcina mazei]|jgi:sporulation protein YlmC with PRC-barrel domain|uniref:Antigen n=1 Tax=Methanosarcina mazei LYC TaxID=1434114 RepID=A0A0E3WQ80_METMZ|nr:PRC-barrel domain-containing protein [Methanosarcina mazei]AKB68790.1 antigen [Methanosarcina mazei LYC]
MAHRDNPEFLSASTIKGDKVVNTAGEDLGKIEELMIDVDDGRIAYAALSFGGFLGMGNKLFAIPWQALKLRLHEHTFLLDIPKETLERAEGFDKDNWPAADREWLSDTYTYYGYQPYWQRRAEEQTEIRGEVGAERLSRESASENPIFLSADSIKGNKVVNRDGNDIGKIDEIMIDLQDGNVAYAAVSHGGILGIGSKLFAIPWKAFSLRIRDNAFILDIPEETFDKAEGFDKSHWPLTRQELSGTFTHYGFEPYWQAAAVGAGVSAGVMGETEAEKMSRMERERKGLVKTDEELKARQERERLEGLKETQEEKISRLEQERMERERQTETERERLSRLEKEQMELENQSRVEKEKLAGLEKELQESIRLEETEKVSRLEKEVNLLQGQEQSRRERLAQLESERARVGKLEETEKERLARLEKERMEAERREESEKERLARLEKERMEAERKVETEQERLARLEKERTEAEKRHETEKERLAGLGTGGVMAAKGAETGYAKMARTEGIAGREGPEFLSASTIKGNKVVNTAGEDLGKIEELMIDLDEGRIGYAVLSFGGFLGLGDKLFSIPWNSLSLRVHEHSFVLDVPKETLEKAEGFDKDNWPVTTRESLSQTYNYYGHEPYWQREATERTGLPGEIGSERVSGKDVTAGRESPEFLSAGTIKGDKVINTEGEDLGKIEELMIDLDDGRVGYAVLSFGGFLGMGDKLFAIPWKALSLKVHEHAFVLNIPKDVLKDAEGFDKDRWPLTRDSLFRTYTYYGYQPYWQKRETAEVTGVTGETAESPREREPARMERRAESESHGQLKTAEEKMAQQDKERIKRMEETETDKEKLERLERERTVAERREKKYQ